MLQYLTTLPIYLLASSPLVSSRLKRHKHTFHSLLFLACSHLNPNHPKLHSRSCHIESREPGVPITAAKTSSPNKQERSLDGQYRLICFDLLSSTLAATLFQFTDPACFTILGFCYCTTTCIWTSATPGISNSNSGTTIDNLLAFPSISGTLLLQ